MSSELAAALGVLFGSAFLSATLLPGSSEVALSAMLLQWPQHAPAAVVVAIVGNTLGGLVSYGLGRLLPAPRTSPAALALARRFGVPALLFSWLPVVGDALCVASGWLRHPWGAAAAAIAIGKAARYVALAEAVRWWGAGSA